LALQDINDNDSAPNFSVKVIQTAMNGNKQVFNTAYKNALNTYVKSYGCSAVSKP
jgi:hypothetical protein